MKQKILFGLLVLTLVALPLFGACAPTPAPAPPTPAPTPAPTPTPTPTHEPVALEIYSNPFGNAGYVLSFALADIINKNSEWLRAVAIESPSGAHNMKILQRSPEKSGVWVGYLNPLSIHHSTLGGAPFTPEEPFKMSVKAVSITANIGAPFLTIDQNIKTPQDLIGKTVALAPKGSTEEFVPRFLLEAWGVYDDVRIVTMAFPAQSDALIDGTIDLGRSGAVILGHEEYADWTPIPLFEKILMARETYIFSTTAEDYAIVRENTGYPVYPIGGKGKTIGKSTLPDWLGSHISLGWFVSENMPDDVITELVRIIYENAELFVTYHANGAAIAKETIGGVAIPRDGYHPAAIEFLEAKGVTVGR